MIFKNLIKTRFSIRNTLFKFLSCVFEKGYWYTKIYFQTNYMSVKKKFSIEILL